MIATCHPILSRYSRVRSAPKDTKGQSIEQKGSSLEPHILATQHAPPSVARCGTFSITYSSYIGMEVSVSMLWWRDCHSTIIKTTQERFSRSPFSIHGWTCFDCTCVLSSLVMTQALHSGNWLIRSGCKRVCVLFAH